MISLYQSGNSWLHLTSARLKLLGLAVILAAVTAWGGTLVPAVGALVLSIAGLFSVRLGYRFIAKLWFSLRWIALLALVPQLFFTSWEGAFANTARVLAGLFFAMLFTITTQNQELIELLESWAKPLARIGIQPSTLGLVVAMALNSIALLGKFATGIREAQLARGVSPRAHRMAVPLLVLSLKHADEYAEALAARGVQI